MELGTSEAKYDTDVAAGITNKLYLVQTYLIRIVHYATIFGLTVDKSCRQEI